jgi:tetratricopeptide (TPR) repeat protein
MNTRLKLFPFLVLLTQIVRALAQTALLYAEDFRLPPAFYLFRDTVYMQNTSTAQTVRLYTAAKTDIEQTLDGAALYRALSRCAYLAGVSFQAEGRKNEAAAFYDEGIAWAEESVALSPDSEGYQYLAANTALSCWVKPFSYALAHADEIEEYAQKALDLDPQNLAAQYIIAAKYIQAPWPVGNMKKGAALLRKIASRDLAALEKEDICNIYLAMAVVCRREKKSGEESVWQQKALALYPGNRFRETLLK